MAILRTKRTNSDLFFAHIGQTSPSPLGIEIQKAEGVFLLGTDGKRYIDLVSGVSVSNVGHAQQAIVEAVTAQAQDYMHLMVYGEVIQSPQVQLAALLAAQFGGEMDTVYFVNSGSEAVEAAMKLAKRVTGRSRMVAFSNAYHGSTQGALSLMGNETFRRSFRPLLPGITHIPFNDFTQIEQITQQTAGVVIEPVQGEAGVRVPLPGFLEALRERCTRMGALLIFDEIQTGFGRTGKLFAMDTFGVRPDILLMAKALGGGMPLGAFACSAQLMRAWQSRPVLGHITTFGGHPVCCAAGLASLRLLLKEDWIAQVAEKEAYVRSRMLSHKAVKAIRSSGLLIAVELESSLQVQQMMHLLPEQGAIPDGFLFCDTAFRIAPPLCITQKELSFACDAVCRALDQLK